MMGILRTRWRSAVALLGLVVVLSPEGFGQCIHELDGRLVASDGYENLGFGFSCDIEADWAVVGTPFHDGGASNSGAAYMFQRIGEGEWVERQILRPAELRAGDQFGYDVSIHRDRMVVSAFGDDERVRNAGAVYVYELRSESWELVEKLFASDPGEDARFGASVDLDVDRLLVGAVWDSEFSPQSGAAYVLDYDGVGWQVEAKLAEPQSDAKFGADVSIRGDIAVVGAPLEDGVEEDEGRAYLYQRNSSGQWQLDQALAHGSPQGNADFGSAVAVYREWLAIGAPGWGSDDEGTVDVYRQVAGLWSFHERIQFRYGGCGDRLGKSLDLHGDRLVIAHGFGRGSCASVFELAPEGSSRVEEVRQLIEVAQPGKGIALWGDAIVASSWNEWDGSSNAGVAYISRRRCDRRQVRDQVQFIPAFASEDLSFGFALCVRGDDLFVGSPSATGQGVGTGVVSRYEWVDGDWSWRELLDTADGEGLERFGQSIAAVKGEVYVAAIDHEDSGRVVVFRDQGGGYQQVQELRHEELGRNADFGKGLAANDEWLFVGAPQDPWGKDLRGRVYVYRRKADEWRFHQFVIAPDPDYWADFGGALALANDRLLVGAPTHASGGRVHLFEFDGKEWQWVELWKSRRPENERNFGSTLCADGDRCAVGDPSELPGGAVYVYVLSKQGTRFEGRLAPDRSNSAGIGSSLALQGETLVVGASGARGRRSSEGIAIGFHLRDKRWSESWRVVIPPAEPYAAGLGRAVALHGTELIAGCVAPRALLRYEPNLAMDAEPDLLRAGEEVSLGVGGADPFSPLLIELVEIDRQPLRYSLLFTQTNKKGRWRTTRSVPLELAGLRLVLRPVGFTNGQPRIGASEVLIID